MRLRIDHRTTYAYQQAASNVVQLLKVTPRSFDGQSVIRWRFDLDVDAAVRIGQDAYGNITHMVYPEASVASLTLRVTGEVEVIDTAGVVIGAPDPLPAAVFLRPTPLTEADPGIADLSASVRGSDKLQMLHDLLASVYATMRFDVEATTVTTRAADAWANRHGVCQDYAHIFIAAARSNGIPARYVSGHLARDSAHEAAHAWAEACVPGLGWVAFDPTNGICATEAYVRVAVGADYADAAPVRGSRRGGGAESLVVAVHAGDPVMMQQQ